MRLTRSLYILGRGLDGYSRNDHNFQYFVNPRNMPIAKLRTKVDLDYRDSGKPQSTSPAEGNESYETFVLVHGVMFNQGKFKEAGWRTLSLLFTFYSIFPFTRQISPSIFFGYTARFTLSPEHRLLMWLEQLPNMETVTNVDYKRFFLRFLPPHPLEYG